MLEDLVPLLSWLVGAFVTIFSGGTALHALFRKRSPRAATVWVGLCVLFPFFGALSYWIFGQNRIFYRARRLRRRWPSRQMLDADLEASRGDLAAAARSDEELTQLVEINRVSDAATGLPLLTGNRVEVLENGDECYPRMIAAIDEARTSVFVETYLFDGPRVTERFGAALERAQRRGVDVRVLIDGLGALVDFGATRRSLQQRGLRVETFLSPSLTGRGLHLNLRNHRKILTVDSTVGFTGGMNLRDASDMLGDRDQWSVRDLHFELHGPIVDELEGIFLEDWCFTTGESLVERVKTPRAAAGTALCRAIPDGPNEDFESLKWILIGAIGSARRRVRVMAPYFIPTEDLETALVAAALRGIHVEVLLPATVDHRVTQWASRAMVWQLVRRGVQVRMQGGDFAHGKLVLIDDNVSIVGSANLDPRSLRLNFEFNVLIHDVDLSARLNALFDKDWEPAREITVDFLDAEPTWKRLRDNLARLAGPYL